MIAGRPPSGHVAAMPDIGSIVMMIMFLPLAAVIVETVWAALVGRWRKRARKRKLG